MSYPKKSFSKRLHACNAAHATLSIQQIKIPIHPPSYPAPVISQADGVHETGVDVGIEEVGHGEDGGAAQRGDVETGRHAISALQRRRHGHDARLNVRHVSRNVGGDNHHRRRARGSGGLGEGCMKGWKELKLIG